MLPLRESIPHEVELLHIQMPESLLEITDAAMDELRIETDSAAVVLART